MNSVSVLFYGRDDNYMPNYVKRVKASIKSFSRALCGIDHEIILTDINQMQGKPFSVHFSDIKNIHNVTITNTEYKNLLTNHFDNGIKIIKDEAALSVDDTEINNFVPTTWATNFCLKHATKDYVIICSTDVLVADNFGEFIKNLRPNILYKCLNKTIDFDENETLINEFLNGKKNTFDNIAILPNTLKRCLIGNGLCFIIDRASAVQVGGFLPYLMNRGKGSDLFFSYFCDAFGKKSNIPSSFVVEMNHPKIQSVSWENYLILKNGVIKFDFKAEFGVLRSWIHLNRAKRNGDFKFDEDFVLKGTKIDEVRKILDAFRPITFFKEEAT